MKHGLYIRQKYVLYERFAADFHQLNMYICNMSCFKINKIWSSEVALKNVNFRRNGDAFFQMKDHCPICFPPVSIHFGIKRIL